MSKNYFFDKPVDVYGNDGTCYPNVVEVCVGGDDESSYIVDVDDEILFFSEMDYTMVENVLDLVEGDYKPFDS
jgi:hypothetical protein